MGPVKPLTSKFTLFIPGSFFTVSMRAFATSSVVLFLFDFGLRKMEKLPYAEDSILPKIAPKPDDDFPARAV